MPNNKILFILLTSLMLVSCKTKPYVETNGVINLLSKQETIKVNFTNKNDVINFLGETIIKDFPDEKSWIYIETESSRDLLGKKNLTKNDLLILDFNEKGIVSNKEFYRLKDMKNIDFAEELSSGIIFDNSVTNKFFYSIKKRVENSKAKLKKRKD